jgi:hypothetical protein
LDHDETQAIARDGGQDDGGQDHAGAVAPGEVREHQAMITSAAWMGKAKGKKMNWLTDLNQFFFAFFVSSRLK